MKISRREFLRRSGCGIGSAAALAAGIERFGLVNAMAEGSGYKALVCVFLAGGNDGNNMVVPPDATGYAAYSAVRSSSDPGHSPREPSADHAKKPGRSIWTASWPGCHTSALRFRQPRDRLQCRAIGGADIEGGVSVWSAPPLSTLLSLGSDRSMAKLRSRRAPRPPVGADVSPTVFGLLPGLPTVTALAGGAFTRGQITSPLSVAPAPTALNQLLSLNGFNTTAADQLPEEDTGVPAHRRSRDASGPRRSRHHRQTRSLFRSHSTRILCWLPYFPTQVLGTS